MEKQIKKFMLQLVNEDGTIDIKIQGVTPKFVLGLVNDDDTVELKMQGMLPIEALGFLRLYEKKLWLDITRHNEKLISEKNKKEQDGQETVR